MTLPRRLKYADRWVFELTQTVGNAPETCNPPIVLASGANLILFELTADEFTRILSALYTGADLSYPDRADDVIYAFVRNVECPVMTTIDCAQVLACIQNTDAIQQAIQNIVQDGINGGGIDVWTPDNPRNGSGAATSTETNAFCADDAALYGASLALWARINATNRDFLEVLDSATNLSGRLGAIIEAIPMIGELPFDDLFQIVEQFGNFAIEGYDAALTAEIEEQLVCDLFCIFKENCPADLGDVMQYFGDKLSSPALLFDTFLDVVSFVITGTFVGIELVYALSLLQLFAVLVGEKWLGLNTARDYVQVVRAGLLEPSNAYQILCNCGAVEWCYNVPFPPSIISTPPNLDANIVGATIAFNNGQGCNPSADVISAIFALPFSDTISRIEIDISNWQDFCGRTELFFQLRSSGNAWLFSDNVPMTGTGTWSHSFSSVGNVGRVRLAGRFSTSDDIRVSGVRVYGTGTPPAQAGNC